MGWYFDLGADMKSLDRPGSAGVYLLVLKSEEWRTRRRTRFGELEASRRYREEIDRRIEQEQKIMPTQMNRIKQKPEIFSAAGWMRLGPFSGEEAEAGW